LEREKRSKEIIVAWGCSDGMEEKIRTPTNKQSHILANNCMHANAYAYVHDDGNLSVHHHARELFKTNEPVAVGVHAADHAPAALDGAPVVAERCEHGAELLRGDPSGPIQLLV
jgi:hypothetical protein